MEITWDNDEGYEIRYAVLAKRYGLDEPYDKAQSRLQSDIRALLAKEQGAQQIVEQAAKARDYAKGELSNLQAHIEQLKKDIGIQQGYYAVEHKPEHAARIKQLEASLAEAINRMDGLNKKIDAPLPSSELDADEKKRLAAAVKLFNCLYSPNPYDQIPVLPVRSLGEPYDLSPDEYARIATVVRAEPPEYCGMFREKVVLNRDDYSNQDFMKAEWPKLGQTAMEILDYFQRYDVTSKSWDGSLYASFGQTFHIRISASRLRDPIDWKGFNFAMINGGSSVPHPVFSGYTMNLPGSFILFNDTIIVRHDFLPRLIVQSSAQPAPLPVDDDDD